MGGFAVRVWAIPIPTYDADIAISVSDEDLRRLLAALERAGFDVQQEHRTGFVDRIDKLQKTMVTRFEDGNVWHFDLFLVRNSFLRSALSSRKTCQIAGQTVKVMSQEDVILLKLAAFRRKDQLDVEDILKVYPNPDLACLRKWAEHLGVTGRLNEYMP